jgi:hypothetical protein
LQKIIVGHSLENIDSAVATGIIKATTNNNDDEEEEECSGILME